MDALESFISSFEAGSGEQEYHLTLARIVRGITFDDSNAELGAGLVRFLTLCNFVSGKVDTRSHSVAKSWEENSYFVEALFSKLGHSGWWWRCSALSGHDEELEWWRQQFQRSPHVAWVSPSNESFSSE